MAKTQRIRGQEVVISVLKDSETVKALSNVRNFTVTPRFSKMEEKYLGETSNRYDEMFDGVNFEFELHMDDPDVLDFVTAIKYRAQRRVGGFSNVKINITATLNFVGGVQPTVNLVDCYFEDMPIGFGSRSDYGTFKVSGSCDDIFAA